MPPAEMFVEPVQTASGLLALQQDDELVVADALAHRPRDDRAVVVEAARS